MKQNNLTNNGPDNKEAGPIEGKEYIINPYDPYNSYDHKII